MKIIRIFAPYLYAIAYPRDYDIVWNEEMYDYFDEDEIGEIDEWERLFDLWRNALYLENFFKKNDEYFDTPYWFAIKAKYDNLSKITKEKAKAFFNKIKYNQKNLEEHFQPLNDDTYIFKGLTKGKSKHSWLRIYAIKIDENRFIVTGGAIKLTHEMKDHDSTVEELKKLEKVKNFLIEKNVFDSDSFNEAFCELDY